MAGLTRRTQAWRDSGRFVEAGGHRIFLREREGFGPPIARIFSPAHPLEREEADDQWSLLAHRQGNRIVDRLTHYLHERMIFAPRWHGALRDWPGRLELAWGMRDPVVVEAVLDAVLALRPHAKVTRFPALGHYPQVEDPAAVAAVLAALAALDQLKFNDRC